MIIKLEINGARVIISGGNLTVNVTQNTEASHADQPVRRGNSGMENEPAKSIITFLGGAKAVAEIVGKHVSRVYRWTYPESVREGTGGLIPAREQRTLLAHAKENGIDLRPEDFHSADRLKDLMYERQVAEAAE